MCSQATMLLLSLSWRGIETRCATWQLFRLLPYVGREMSVWYWWYISIVSVVCEYWCKEQDSTAGLTKRPRIYATSNISNEIWCCVRNRVNRTLIFKECTRTYRGNRFHIGWSISSYETSLAQRRMHYSDARSKLHQSKLTPHIVVCRSGCDTASTKQTGFVCKIEDRHCVIHELTHRSYRQNT